MSDAPAWVQRYTATSFWFPSWAADHPERLAVISNRSGSLQAWCVDLATGTWRQASDEPAGTEYAWMAPDGRVCWWRDDTGDERGHVLVAPFDGSIDPEPLFPDLEDGWLMGLSLVGTRMAICLERDGVYTAYVADAGGGARVLVRSETSLGVGNYSSTGGLSADGELVGLRHAEGTDILHEALRVVHVNTGEAIGELRDEGRQLEPGPWSPVKGDQRMLLPSEQLDRIRPAIWNVTSGERIDLVVDLPGDAIPVDWYPDGEALLIQHEHDGRAQLYRMVLATGELELVANPGGDINHAGMRPDGVAWFRASDAVNPPRLLSSDGHEVVPNPDQPAPLGRPFRDLVVTNPSGDRIHGFVCVPDGEGPFPTVMSIHGGPEWHERDAFDPEVQAFVDAGYAVVLVNYRGSTGYGRAHREALIRNVCLAETEDIIACLDAVVADGTADPDNIFWSGWSWGGCLGCFNAGVHPDRWRALFLGIPSGDFVSAHQACAPELRDWDIAVYGGGPDELPELYARSNPMTYVANVRAPSLVIAGQADPRCPVEGVTPWVEAVQALGVPVEVEWYPEGHHTTSMDGQVKHMQLILDFFDRYR